MLINKFTGRAAGGGTPPENPPPKTTGAATSQDQLAKIDALKKKLQATKETIEGSKDYFQFLSMEDQAKTAQTLTSVDAELAMLDTYAEFVQTGKWDPTNIKDGVDPAKMNEYLSTLQPGWNDASGAIKTVTDDKDKAKLLNPQTYVGTIILDNSGVYDATKPQNSNALNFVVPDGATEVYGTTIGKDIEIDVRFADNHIETYILKNMAVRPESIYIFGGNSTKDLTIDMSRVMRVSDGNWGQPFGTTNGMTLIGGSGKDRILGSQGNDLIIGGAGGDGIYGLGGDDEIYGDAYNQNGSANFQTTDGNDTVDGGAGSDTIRTGGGDDQVLHKTVNDGAAENENPGEASVYEKIALSGETAKDGELVFKDVIDTPSAAGATKIEKDGTIAIDADGLTGPLDLKMPTGYSMASADLADNGKSIIITMSGVDQNGLVHEMRVKINHFFDPANHVVLNFHGNDTGINMIDFGRITLEGNTININAGGGDDTIVAPNSYLDALGISLNEVGKTNVSHQTLINELDLQNRSRTIDGKIVSGIAWGLENVPNIAKGDFHWSGWDSDSLDTLINDKNEIELKAEAGADGTITWPKTLDFAKLGDFEHVVQKKDGPDQLLIFMHTNQSDGTTEQMVVRIKDVPDTTKILVGGVAPDSISGTPWVAGGDGTDTVFASQTAIDTSNASNDNVITGTYTAGWVEPPKAEIDLATQIQDKKDEIEKLNTALGQLQDALDQETDPDKQAKKQKLVDAKQNEVDTAKTELKILEQKLPQ